MGFRTPDRFPGKRDEEEICLEEKPASAPSPTQEGVMRYQNGAFLFVDNIGAYDPRSGGGGLDQNVHEQLDTLTHCLVEDRFEEVSRDGLQRAISLIAYTDNTKSTKIRELQVSYVGLSRRVDQSVIIQYDGSGAETYRLTTSYAYNGTRLLSADVVRTP